MTWIRLLMIALVAVPALALGAGLAAFAWGDSGLAGRIWTVGTVPVLATLVVQIVQSLRRGEFGLDLIAALAMAGSLALGEHLAGVVIALMFAGGQGLEAGTANAGAPFMLTATRPAAASTYARIIRLVETAQRSKAPMARLADRWALLFLGLTAALATTALAATDDPVRALAVLVVATPCPLILAVPAAIVSGK
jgi:cation transport ATPase